MCRLAGTGERASGPDGLPARETKLYWVSAVRKSPDGRVYVMDQNNNRLRAIEHDGTMSTIAGTGEHLGAIDGAPARQSPLLDPIDFDFRPDGRVVIVAWHDQRLLEVGLDGNMHVIAGLGHSAEEAVAADCRGTGDGGPAEQGGFCEIVGIAISHDGRIFLADGLAHQIRVIEPDGTLGTIAGDGTRGYDGDGGPATSAHLDTPSAIAVDHDGILYVADTGNQVVRRIDAAGNIDTVVGNHVRGFSGDGGPCRDARMNAPSGVAVSSDGVLWVSDTYNNRVRRVDLAADTIQTYAGTGTVGLDGDRGPALAAELFHPMRLSISKDEDGERLYIGDLLNNVARAVRLR